MEDPELPDDFMSQPKFRADAIEVFNTLYQRLAEASDRYFCAATDPAISRSAAKRGAAVARRENRPAPASEAAVSSASFDRVVILRLLDLTSIGRLRSPVCSDPSRRSC